MMAISIQVPSYAGASPGDFRSADMPTPTRTVLTAAAEPEVPPVVGGADGSLFLNTDSMKTGTLYPAVLDGVQVVLRRNRDGSIDFFSAP